MGAALSDWLLAQAPLTRLHGLVLSRGARALRRALGARPRIARIVVGPGRGALRFDALATGGLGPAGAALRRVAGRDDGFLVLDHGTEGWVPSAAIRTRLAEEARAAGLRTRPIWLSQNRALADGDGLVCAFHHSFALALLARAAAQRGRILAADGTPGVDLVCRSHAPRPHRLLAMAGIAALRAGLTCDMAIGAGKGPRALEEALALAARSDLARALPDGARCDASALSAFITGEADHDGARGARMALATEWPHLRNARICVVLETEMSAGDTRRFTEKSLQPMLAGRPALIFGNPGVTDDLRRLFGVAAPTPFGDEIDADTDPANRLRKGLDQIERLATMPDAARAALFDDLTAVARKDQAILLTEGAARLEAEILTSFTAALIRARAT